MPRPKLLEAYNECMGGTDQMDQSIATYPPLYTKQKVVLANICLLCAGQFVQLVDIVQTVGEGMHLS